MFSGAVLTGGAGTRMGPGVDKALVAVGGRAMGAIAADALRAAGAAEVLAIGGSAPAGLTAVPDRYPGEGPLGGIITALGAAAHPVVVVLACDLPDVTAAVVATVLEGLDDARVDAAVPVGEVGLEPLCAAYRRSCLPAFEEMFRQGERSPRRALGGVAVVEVAVRDPKRLRSANRPEDLPRP